MLQFFFLIKFLFSRPYKPSITYTTNGKSATTPNSSQKKKQIFIHVGQKDGDVTTTSNFDHHEDHKVSQVIEPVVKTITSAIRQRYSNQYGEATAQSKYDSLQAPNRRIGITTSTQCSKIGKKVQFQKYKKTFLYFHTWQKKSIFAPEKSLKLPKMPFSD